VPIRSHLNGQRFDIETIRVMGLAYEMALVALERTDGAATPTREAVAQKIIDLAKAGERDPERLCDEALKAPLPMAPALMSDPSCLPPHASHRCCRILEPRRFDWNRYTGQSRGSQRNAGLWHALRCVPVKCSGTKSRVVVTAEARLGAAEHPCPPVASAFHRPSVLSSYSRALTPAIAQARPRPQASKSPSRLHSQATA
jgi:hypothetical protein